VAACSVLFSSACIAPEPQPYIDLVDLLSTAEVEGPKTAEDERVDPASDSTADHLFLPVGSRVTYAFFAEPESSLEVERLAIRGDDTEVSLVVETDHAEPRAISQRRSRRDWSQSLYVPGAAPVRLSLQVTAATASPGDGALLTRPEIHGLVEDRVAETLAPKLLAGRPNIIIYLIDTLRRDRLGSYGYDRPVSPRIDAFAAEATLFSSGHGQSSWTKPTVASVFTGFWPPRHGATGWKHRLAEDFVTLPELLRDAGWVTAAFVTNINASDTFGVAQGFDTLWYKRKVDANRVNTEVFNWLDSLDRSHPFLLYVHTMDPHAGYKPREPYRTQFAPTADQMPSWKPRWRWPKENAPFFSDLYDGEVAQNDAAFGALVDRLIELDLYDDSLVIFLSDHGEEFREHGGWRHNRRLYAETLDVPIIVKFPGQHEGRVSDVPVSHVDILPTVLHVTDLPPFDEVEGQSLVRPESRPVFSHLRVGRYPLQYSVIDHKWKLIRTHKQGLKVELFDIATDPGETRNLAPELPVRTAAMAALLDRHLATTGETRLEAPELSEETERELRALGYLQ
jgi:arylsulfatase A-like enzyme